MISIPPTVVVPYPLNFTQCIHVYLSWAPHIIEMFLDISPNFIFATCSKFDPQCNRLNWPRLHALQWELHVRMFIISQKPLTYEKIFMKLRR